MAGAVARAGHEAHLGSIRDGAEHDERVVGVHVVARASIWLATRGGAAELQLVAARVELALHAPDRDRVTGVTDGDLGALQRIGAVVAGLGLLDPLQGDGVDVDRVLGPHVTVRAQHEGIVLVRPVEVGVGLHLVAREADAGHSLPVGEQKPTAVMRRDLCVVHPAGLHETSRAVHR